MLKVRARNPFSLTGRAGRREFATSAAILLGARFALSFSPIDPYAYSTAAGLIVLAFAPRLVRRLHDLGRSGWWVFLLLLAMWTTSVIAFFLGLTGQRPQGVWPLVLDLPDFTLLAGAAALCVLPGQRQENRYGQPALLPLKEIFG